VTIPTVLPPLVTTPDELRWDDSADVVVVGLGGAGACAAIEAADQGAHVVAIDRLVGGGDTAMSGGVVYAGGGTPAQVAAGYSDTIEATYAYLRQEVGGAVPDAALRRFCAESGANLEWLQEQGVAIGGRLWPHKTAYPPDGYFLYFSGSEQTGPFDREAPPAPRAHRTHGKGMGVGAHFFRALEASAVRRGVRIRTQTRARRLVVDPDGRIVGVECLIFPDERSRRRHERVARLARSLPPLVSLGPAPPVLFGTLRRLEARHQTEVVRLRARGGVVLATGGYQHNRRLIGQHAPYAQKLLTIGLDANGAGILLGRTVGAATGFMDNVGVFRMFIPPLAFGKGMLVDAEGRRFANELWYSGRVGKAMTTLPGGKAYLILDARLAAAARAELPGLHIFNSAPARLWLALAKKADSPTGLAARLGVPPAALAASVTEYNATAGGAPDRFGKAPASCAALTEPPLVALDLSLYNRSVPATTFSLGGLEVSGETGEVLSEGGGAIPGLYAAGRAAVGLCSSSYVSGLSLADCVFSGRRAGAHAARVAQFAPDHGGQPDAAT